MPAQIFISYRREDGAYPAHILHQYLIDKGYSVFYDVKSLRSGVFSNEIEKNMVTRKDPESIEAFKSMELLKCFEDQFYSDTFWYCEYDYIGIAKR